MSAFVSTRVFHPFDLGRKRLIICTNRNVLAFQFSLEPRASCVGLVSGPLLSVNYVFTLNTSTVSL